MMRPRNRLSERSTVTRGSVSTVFDELLSGVKSFLAGFGGEPARSFIDGIDWAMPARKLVPRGLPCLVHLDRAAEIAGDESRPLARFPSRPCRSSFTGARPTPQPISAKSSSTITAGWKCSARAAISPMTQLAGGFLILGPGIEYPDHHHVAEELYIPLTGGTEWRMGGGPSVCARPARSSTTPRMSATPCAPATNRCLPSISGAAGRLPPAPPSPACQTGRG